MNRIATTLVALGIAAVGSIAIAPAASAAPVQDGPSYVIDGPGMNRDNGNGPDAFIVTEHGRTPVFFCDDEKPKKHANKCAPVGNETSGRF
jgi:hypothetical protein